MSFVLLNLLLVLLRHFRFKQSQTIISGTQAATCSFSIYKRFGELNE